MATHMDQDVYIALNAGILSHFDPTTQRYECVVCPKVGFDDVMPHLSNSQHRNSAAWETIYARTPNDVMLGSLSKTIREAKINDEIDAVDKKVFSYRCKICPTKRPFNGLAPLESHVCGGDHAKCRGRLSYSRSGPGFSSSSPSSQSRSPAPAPTRYFQQPTNQQNPRLSPTKSPQREYKVPQFQNHPVTSSPSSSSNEGAGSSDNQHWPSLTSASSSNQAPCANNPYQSGSASHTHQPLSFNSQDTLTAQINDAIESGIVVEREKTGNWTSYFCNACGVPLTGLQPLKQHMRSTKHLKKVNGHQIFSTNASGAISNLQPQLVQDFVGLNTLSESAREALSSGAVEENSGAFFCKVCNVPLTGPMPLNQHADSEKHRKKTAMQMTTSMSHLKISPITRPSPITPPSNPWERASDSQVVNPPCNNSGTSRNHEEIDERTYFKWEVKSAKNLKKPSEEVYRNISMPRGFVVIFNYYFSGSHERRGARRDSQNLKILFTRMSYRVRLCEDYNKEKTLSMVKEIQSDEWLNKCDSFICIILSHGKDGSCFYTTSLNMNEDLDLDDVRYHFTDSACPQLRSKPKIFLTNFCRGKVKELPHKLDHDFVSSEEKSEAPQDMLTIYASIKNFSAVRHQEDGTIFVQAVCEVLAENAHDTEITILYRKICDVMRKLDGTTPEQQDYYFRKSFYFNPYNVENCNN